jgi:hypothetical protein
VIFAAHIPAQLGRFMNMLSVPGDAVALSSRQFWTIVVNSTPSFLLTTRCYLCLASDYASNRMVSRRHFFISLGTVPYGRALIAQFPGWE